MTSDQFAEQMDTEPANERPPTVEAQALMAFRADILEHMSTDLSEAWGEP